MNKYSNNKNSIELVNLLLDNIHHVRSTNDFNIINNSNSVEIHYSLYKKIQTKNTFCKSPENQEQITREIVNKYSNTRDIINNLKSAYVSNKIQKYIETSRSTLVKYTIKMGIEYVIYFNVYNDSFYNKFNQKLLDYIDLSVLNVLSIIYFLEEYRGANCKCERLELYLFLTDYKKELPKTSNKVIDAENVNTGLTSPFQKTTRVYIYRREEYMKLVIHELLHALGIDMPGYLHKKYTNYLDDFFGIESTYNLNETYTEIWALIINALFIIVNGNEIDTSREVIMGQINTCLKLENVFSGVQVYKILDFMTLSLEDLKSNTKNHKFREETNVFAYYILKYILLNSLDDFLELSGNSNISFQGILSQQQIIVKCDKLLNMITKKYLDNQFLYNYKSIIDLYMSIKDSNIKESSKNMIKNTMRMTVLELA